MGRVGHSGLGHSCVLNHVRGHGHGGDGAVACFFISCSNISRYEQDIKHSKVTTVG